MKKILAIVAVVILGAAGTLLLVQPRRAGAPDTRRPASPTEKAPTGAEVSTSAPVPTGKVYPSFANLQPQTLIAASFTRQSIERDTAPMVKVWNSFLTTSLAHKVGVEQSLGALLTLPQSATAQGADLKGVVEFVGSYGPVLRKHWTEFDRAVFAVTSDSDDSDSRGPLNILARFSFASDAPVKALQQSLDDAAKAPQNVGGSTVLIDAQAGGRYVVSEQKSDALPAKELIAVAFDSQSVSLTYGTREPGDFFTPNASAGLTASDEWRAVSKAAPSPNDLTFFAQPRKLAALLVRSKQIATDKKLLSAMDTSLEQWESTDSYLFGLPEKSAGHFCMRTDLTSENRTSRYYRAFLFEPRKTPRALARLIGDQTVLSVLWGVGNPHDVIDYYQDFVSEALPPSGTSTAASPAATPTLDPTVSKLFGAAHRLAFKDFGFILDSPTSLAVPNIHIYLGESALSGVALLNQFAESINAVAPAPQALASMTKLSDGSPAVALQAMGPVSPLVTLVGENSLLISAHDAARQAAATALKAGTPYLTRAAPSSNLLRAADAAMSFTFINTEPLIQSAKLFAPMFVPQPLPNDVQMAEVFEAADLLKGKLFTESSFSREAPDVLCSEGRAHELGKP